MADERNTTAAHCATGAIEIHPHPQNPQLLRVWTFQKLIDVMDRGLVTVARTYRAEHCRWINDGLLCPDSGWTIWHAALLACDLGDGSITEDLVFRWCSEIEADPDVVPDIPAIREVLRGLSLHLAAGRARLTGRPGNSPHGERIVVPVDACKGVNLNRWPIDVAVLPPAFTYHAVRIFPPSHPTVAALLAPPLEQKRGAQKFYLDRAFKMLASDGELPASDSAREVAAKACRRARQLAAKDGMKLTVAEDNAYRNYIARWWRDYTG